MDGRGLRIHSVATVGFLLWGVMAAGCGDSTPGGDGASPLDGPSGLADLTASNPDGSGNGMSDLTVVNDDGGLVMNDDSAQGTSDLTTVVSDDGGLVMNDDSAQGAADLITVAGDDGGSMTQPDLTGGVPPDFTGMTPPDLTGAGPPDLTGMAPLDLTVAGHPDLTTPPVDMVKSAADLVTPPGDMTASCTPDGKACNNGGRNGLCKTMKCSQCVDKVDDGACNAAYGGMGTGYLCRGGNCVPGNCRVDSDCAAGQICGVGQPNFCGKCATDTQCQLDPGYGKNFICNLVAGTCVSSACSGPKDTLCTANMSDVCCPSGAANNACVFGNCCDDAFCKTKGNNYICSNHVCTTCPGVTNGTYYVDPSGGDDSVGTGSAAGGGKCDFKTVARALQVIGAMPGAMTKVIVIGPSTVSSASNGEVFPLIVPMSTTISGMGPVTVKVTANQTGFVLAAAGASLKTLTIDGQSNTALFGVLALKGSNDGNTLQNVTIQNFARDGILVQDGRISVLDGVVSTGNGTLNAPASGLRVTGSTGGSANIFNTSAAGQPTQFSKNTEHGIIVEGSGAINLQGVANTNGAGTVQTVGNHIAGVWIQQLTMTGQIANTITGLTSTADVAGNGLRIHGGSIVKVRQSRILGNSANGIYVTTHVVGATRYNDLSRIDLGMPNDHGGNLLQLKTGPGGGTPNGGAGICLDVDPNSGKLAAVGNTFAGPIDCTQANPGKLTSNARCDGAVDVGITAAGNDINVANCTH